MKVMLPSSQRDTKNGEKRPLDFVIGLITVWKSLVQGIRNKWGAKIVKTGSQKEEERIVNEHTKRF